MREHQPNIEAVFSEGTLVFTGKSAKLEDYLYQGIPWGGKHCLFGNPKERDIRLGLLGKRELFPQRLQYGSCLVPQFKREDTTYVGLALETSRLVLTKRDQLSAIGHGFQEPVFQEVYSVKNGQVGGILVSSCGEVGFLDEVRLRLPKDENYLGSHFIKGVLVNKYTGKIGELAALHPDKPFFLSSGELIKLVSF